MRLCGILVEEIVDYPAQMVVIVLNMYTKEKVKWLEKVCPEVTVVFLLDILIQITVV